MKYTIKRGVVLPSENGKFETIEEANKELAKRKKRNDARKERDDVMRSCGLVKVKGALGGTYWE
jgi:hypothetical protein